MDNVFIRSDEEYFTPDCPRRAPAFSLGEIPYEEFAPRRILLAGERRRRRQRAIAWALGLLWAATLAAIVLCPIASTKAAPGPSKRIVVRIAEVEEGSPAAQAGEDAPPPSPPPSDNGDDDGNA
jgi:hypothetical protein